jgi:hypothetical protein
VIKFILSIKLVLATKTQEKGIKFPSTNSIPLTRLPSFLTTPHHFDFSYKTTCKANHESVTIHFHFSSLPTNQQHILHHSIVATKPQFQVSNKGEKHSNHSFFFQFCAPLLTTKPTTDLHVHEYDLRCCK